MGVFYEVKQRRKLRKIERGKGVWGRQDAETKITGTISAKVTRADGTVEDLGVISEVEVENGDSPN